MRLFGDASSMVDDPYFAHALALAEKARGRTSPNPLVGCVVVSEGHIVGEGFHARAGTPHAEVVALADAGTLARGAVVYVTLEPCAHTGRTAPCTEALVDAGVGRVVIGMADPNPIAAGGADALRAAGIEVEFAPDPRPFAELNEEWLKRTVTGLPFVTAKLGLTLDARTSLVAGRRAAITGVSGAEVTRRLREGSAAVAVGVATVIADDPLLTVRSAENIPAPEQPLRLILVRETPPPSTAALFADTTAETAIVAPNAANLGAAESLASRVVRYDATSGATGMLRAIAGLGVDSVLVEAGPRLLTSLWTERVLDRLVTVTAGGMGGLTAPPTYLGAADAVGDEVVSVLSPVETGIVGEVSVTVWRPEGTDVTI